jgi:hypothetical protein
MHTRVQAPWDRRGAWHVAAHLHPYGHGAWHLAAHRHPYGHGAWPVAGHRFHPRFGEGWHPSTAGFEPAAGIRLARTEIEQVARQIRTRAPELAEELVPAAREAFDRTARTAQTLLPERRRRRQRWPLLLVAGLVTLGVAALIVRKAKARRSALPMPISMDWEPSGPGRAGSEDLLVQRGANPEDELTPRHPANAARDAAAEAATFDRDAEDRAESEGMEAPEQPPPFAHPAGIGDAIETADAETPGGAP